MSAGCNISGAYCPYHAYYSGIFSVQSKCTITTSFCCTCGMMHVLFILSAISVILPYFLYTVSEKDCTLFLIFFFSRCPVCGEWCKLH